MFPIIDCHCHIYPSKIAEKAVMGIGNFYHIDMVYDGKLETLLKENKKGGITHSLIFSVATKPSQTQSINEFIASTVAQDPTRLTGLGTLHPDSSDIKGDIDHLVDLGLRGVKLHPDFQGVKIDDDRCMKIYELCQGRLPVLFHTGDKRYNFSNPDNVLPVLKAFPNLTVIGAHFGGYSVWEEAERKLEGIKNFYVDCSSAMAFLSVEKTRELVRGFGADHVVFGTDFPMWNIPTEVARFEALGLTDEEKQKIYYKNACSLFKIDQAVVLEKFKKDVKNA
jgi:predicted TIM-barrel fold metal-dependent hydrolase